MGPSYSNGEAQRRARVTRFVAVALVALGAVAFSLTSASGAAGDPEIASAETGDADFDGRIDFIQVTYDQPMSQTSTPVVSDGTSPGFFLGGGYEIAALQWANSTQLKISVVEKTAPNTAATPAVTYVSGGGGAISAFALASEAVAETETPLDRAKPVLLSFAANDLPNVNMFNASGDEAYISFSEPAAIAGATAVDRWSNLEKAFLFTSVTTGEAPYNNGCPRDGVGLVTEHNFPQPRTNPPGTPDPILVPPAPAGGSSQPLFAQQFHVKHNGNLSSTAQGQFLAIPRGCWVGIDPNFHHLLTDANANTAAHQNLPGTNLGRIRIVPAEVNLVTAKTADLGPIGGRDGVLDAIELTFNQRIKDDSVVSHLSSFRVRLEDQDAVVTGVDTGAVLDDNIIRIRFTAPSNSWHTGIKPRIAYAKPDGCEPNATTPGVKGIVPVGDPWRACVASFDVASADGAGPLLLDLITGDSDTDGLLDRITAVYNEDIVSGSAAGWTVNTAPATTFAVDSAAANKVHIGFAEGTVGDTGTFPQVQYARATGETLDAGLAEIEELNASATKDAAAPRIMTASQYDVGESGSITRVVLEYSESLVDPASSAASDFTVDGATATAFVAAPGGNDPGLVNDRFLSLAVGVPGTEAKPVAFGGTATIADAAGNATGAEAAADIPVVDLAKPVAAISVTPNRTLSVGAATIKATFSEAMNVSAGAPATATFSSTVGTKNIAPIADSTHTNGWLASGKVWEGTIDIVAEDCGESLGCTYTATIDGASDLASPANPQVAGTKQVEVDTVGPTSVIPGAFAATLASGESAPANTVNMFTTGFSLTAAIPPAEADGGTAEILLGGAPLSPPALVTGISGSEVTAATAFADAAALQEAIVEGTHELTVKVCDDALNCTTSATGVTITADYTPVDATLTAPNGGNVVAGNSTLDIEWSTDSVATDLASVSLEYSTDDGATFPNPIATNQLASGSYSWTVPEIEAPQAKVRAVSIDSNGNKAFAASAESFAIDSFAPVIRITSPSTSDPFLAAGKTHVVMWEATDATIDRVTDPIVIEFSTDGGTTWTEINGGSYSGLNDGEETWNVPNGTSFTTLLRVKATDGADHVGEEVSTKLAKGVEGYVLDKTGRVHSFGTADATTRESLTRRSDWARGFALRSNGVSGYVVNHVGSVYPFAVGDASMPKRPKTRYLGYKMARGVVARGTYGGYVLDKYGRLHAFGGAPGARPSKTWIGYDRARGVMMLPNLRGGYVLDAYGRLHPFSVGRYAKPKSIQSYPAFSRGNAAGFVLRDNLKNGYLLDTTGKLRSFGGAPTLSSTGIRSTAGAKGLVKFADNAGYWVDHRGILHAYGAAFGNPTRTTLSNYWARGIS